MKATTNVPEAGDIQKAQEEFFAASKDYKALLDSYNNEIASFREAIGPAKQRVQDAKKAYEGIIKSITSGLSLRGRPRSSTPSTGTRPSAPSTSSTGKRRGRPPGSGKKTAA
jgi:hypothetical protein